MTRGVKQIAYGTFYLAIFVAIIAGFYFVFLKPAPSCFDNIQNQKEEGIDCGGPCSGACIPASIKSIEIVDRILFFEPAPSSISFLARVSNPNLAYATKNFSYQLSLRNASGTIVKSIPGNSFIYAGEVKYIFMPNVGVSRSLFDKADLEINGVSWLPANEFVGPPQLAVSRVQTNVSNSRVIAEGQATNNDIVSFPRVTVLAIFKGKLGQTAGVSQTELDNLSPNESRQFSVSYPAVTDFDISATQVYAYAARE
jgi:hypothetical protein